MDMIDEPAAVAEGFARSTGVYKTEEQVEGMRFAIPSAIFSQWLDIVDALQVDVPAGNRVEVFPPGLRDALKENEDAPVKRVLLQPALGQIRELGAAKATPGDAPESRTLNVPSTWLAAYWRARDEFARKMSDAFVEATRGEGLIVRNERGLFARSLEGGLAKVAEPNVDEEGPVYCAPFGKNGTWNLYQVIARPSTWLLADKAAREITAPVGEKKIAGHLVSIHSAAENHFVVRLIEGLPHVWIGLNDRRLEAFRDKAGTWEWSSGEPVTFRNWNALEPNNANTPRNGGDEDGVVIDAHNIPGRYGVWTDFADGSRVGYNHRYGFVVEWSVEAVGPIPGAKLLPSFFAEPLPGHAGREGAFGMRIVYGGGACRTLESAREAYLSGGGRVVEAHVPFIHHRDPDRSAPGVLFPGALPFPGQVEKQPDKDVAFLYRGRIRVAEAGVYTFGVIHDDGFALRIAGQRWLSVTGHGMINPSDPSSLEQHLAVDQGCTLATVELAAGVHELEFFGFQTEGGGYFQLFSAKGKFAGLHETRDWRLVGHLSVGEISMPGMVAPGWQVEATAQGALVRSTYEGAQRALERHGKRSETPEPVVDYFDPEDGSDLRLSGAKPFPGGKPGQKDNAFAFRARGVLEIPKRGTYWIGYQSARGGRLSIQGQKWKHVFIAPLAQAVVDEDLIESDANAETGCRIVAEIDLDAGRYPMEFLGCFSDGPAAVEITATHPNGPDLHLKAVEARVVQDVPGLELVK